MNARSIGPGLCLFVVILSATGCGTERSELIYEEVIIQLPDILEVTTTVTQNSCAGASGQASGAFTVADIVQEGNDFSWRQEGTSSDSLELQFSGRICSLDDNRFELRLKGEAVVRVPEDEGFCRTTLIAPSSFGRCGEIKDLCQDDATIKLTWDECSGTFSGFFSVNFAYTEACVNVTDCDVDVGMIARLPSSTNSGCDTVQVNENVNCGSASQRIYERTN